MRTPAEARKTAGEDLKVQLGLLDARHVAGDPALTAGLRTAVLADWRDQAPKRLPELRRAVPGTGRARTGELRFLLEPDLKEARGGLRDATALRAVAASWLADAPREGLAEARAHAARRPRRAAPDHRPGHRPARPPGPGPGRRRPRSAGRRRPAAAGLRGRPHRLATPPT